MFALQWIAQHCMSAKLLLKADDDVIISLPYAQTLLQGPPLNRSVIGKNSITALSMCQACQPEQI